ncbi:cytidine deaminase-like protein [Mycena galopus ATCC 62051]|nr:cytidine deaminase-like protein [Mycena galopus ATCC 62051]
MLVAIIGTRSSGKTAVENYLVSKDFERVRIDKPRCFSSASALLEFVTQNWRRDFVTFVREDDSIVFGAGLPVPLSSLHSLGDLVNIHVSNDFSSLSSLHSYLDDLNLLDPGHLRPQWDAYFMTLASLASKRSNCMKRRVGAVLVRENRILATGYNGTPRGVKNCNEGGCFRCNESEYECVCLHAEENALLEAGRERVGQGSVLYCNTCPCLKCTIKIIQTGVKTVVYNLSYKVDDASARLLAEAGVELRRFQPSNKIRL